MSQAVLYTYHQHIVGFMLTGALAHENIYIYIYIFFFYLFEITIWNKMRILYSRIVFFFFLKYYMYHNKLTNL